MTDWLYQLEQVMGEGEPAVLISVAAVRGSAPRESGASMTVAPTCVRGTIGGGNLEFIAIDLARQVLAGQETLPEGGELRRFVLGTELGQCCGGVAFLHFELVPANTPDWLNSAMAMRQRGEAAMLLSRREGDGVVRAVITAERAENFGSSNPLRQATAEARRRLAARDSETDLLWSADGEKPREPEHQDFVLMRPLLPGDFQILLFGAGHVGRALVRVLEPLVDRIVWSDGRPEEFPALLPPNVRADSGDPFELIAAMPPGALYLVMTHNHSLDLALCEAVLQRRDHAYLGLIGSASKRRRFEKHLREEGLTDADLQRLTSPIGVPGIRSKEPAAIAVAVAAQLLQVRERLVACGSKRATSAVVRSA